MMTKEYPPEIYGGAGVHVTELTRFMREIVDVDVHCMGTPRDMKDVYVHGVDPALENANGAIKTLSTGLRIAHAANNVDVAHSHTWYAGLGGHLTGLLYDIPHVVTAHSLEPDRPWKREQLGGGYNVSSWSEKNAFENADAVIAVSAGMKEAILRAYPSIPADKIHVVLNGIDPAKWYPTEGTVLTDLGVDPAKPIVAFTGCAAPSLNAATAERIASSRPVPLYVATSLAVSSWSFCSSNGHAHGFMSESMSRTTLPSSMDRPASLAVSLSENPWPSMDKA